MVGGPGSQGNRSVSKSTTSTLERNTALQSSSSSQRGCNRQHSTSKAQGHVRHQLDTMDLAHRHAHPQMNSGSDRGPTSLDRIGTNRHTIAENRNSRIRSKRTRKGGEPCRSRSRSRPRTRWHTDAEGNGSSVPPTESAQQTKSLLPTFHRITEEKRYYSYPRPGARKLPGIEAYQEVVRATYTVMRFRSP